VTTRTPPPALGEGNTPLVRAASLERETGVDLARHEGMTGNGLEDPDTARSLGREVVDVDATADAVMGAIAHATRA
jgi:hypothetical protein